MSGKQDQDSFDFSNPFVTVEVEAKSKNDTETVVGVSSLEERFEAAKNNTEIPEDSEIPDTPVIKKKDKHRAHKAHSGSWMHQWFVTFILLASLFAVSTFALINYKQNTQKYADLVRESSQKKNVSSSTGVQFVGKGFSIVSPYAVPREYTSSELLNNTKAGFERPFNGTDLLLGKGTALQTGIIVLQQENATSQPPTLDAVLAQLKQSYTEDNYNYAQITKNGAYSVIKPKNSSLPIILVDQGNQELRLIEVHVGNPDKQSEVDRLVSGLVFN